MTDDPRARAQTASRADGLRLSTGRADAVARRRIGIGAAVVLAILAMVVAVVVTGLGATGTATVVTPGPAAPSHATSAAAGVQAVPAAPVPSTDVGVYVHVLGAVATEGLFHLATGARVVDAVAAAGGFAGDAERGGVNLARVLADGEQLVVPRVGEVAPGAAPGAPSNVAPGGAPGGAGAPVPGAAGGLVNLNTATAAELETLPRIGPAMAERILAWRDENGGFGAVDDLLEVTGIGEKTLDAFRELVTI